MAIRKRHRRRSTRQLWAEYEAWFDAHAGGRNPAELPTFDQWRAGREDAELDAQLSAHQDGESLYPG